MRIFRSNQVKSYSTFVGGESFNKEESKNELNINLNGISRSQRELNFLTSEVKALELRSKYNKYEGKEYKLKVKELTKEIKEKNRRIQIVTRQEQGAKSKSKLELLKELLSFK